MGSTYDSIVDVLRKYNVQLRTDPEALELDVLLPIAISNQRLRITPSYYYPDEHPNNIKLYIGYDKYRRQFQYVTDLTSI